MSSTILTISSYTAYDYCGNKITSAVLQILGHDVAILNTTNLSNPLGPLYPKSAGGSILSGAEFRENFAPFWRDNNLAPPKMVVVGYLPSADLVEAVADFVDEIKPEFLIIDPIFGDHGRFYNSPDIVEPFKNRLVSKADLVTPNYFEACLLANFDEKEPISESTITKLSQELIDLGAKNVIISSADYSDHKLISCLATKSFTKTFLIEKLDCYVLGTGDFFTGLLSHILYQYNELSAEKYLEALDLTGKLMRKVLEVGKKDMNPFLMIDEIRKL